MGWVIVDVGARVGSVGQVNSPLGEDIAKGEEGTGLNSEADCEVVMTEHDFFGPGGCDVGIQLDGGKSEVVDILGTVGTTLVVWVVRLSTSSRAMDVKFCTRRAQDASDE